MSIRHPCLQTIRMSAGRGTVFLIMTSSDTSAASGGQKKTYIQCSTPVCTSIISLWTDKTKRAHTHAHTNTQSRAYVEILLQCFVDLYIYKLF